jgi:iron(III) transport system substrate-binding protein
MKHTGVFLLLLTPLFFGCAQPENELNLYSARHYDTDIALYENFTKETGIKVNLIEGKSDALIERIANEGELSPADVLVTVDAGRLWRAEERGIFQPIKSDILNNRIPANLRQADGKWFGISKRNRVIVINAETELPINIKRYEDLADPALKGLVCMRSSGNIYNISLMASVLEVAGAEGAANWAKGVASNFARDPQSNDTGQIRAVASGECKVSIANTYYIGRLLASRKPEDKAVIDGIRIVFPNQSDRGTHVNISGAGVVASAPNRENAIKFIEYLTSDEAQRIFAEGNNEYPVIGEATGPISTLGSFNEDQISASILGIRQKEAVELFDQAGWL